MPDPSPDTYTHGHSESVLRSHRWRTIANSAAYLEAHLVAGVRVLDVGCGPGTISAEMATRVAPGTVTAIDYSADVVATAAADHAEVKNVTFEAGDVYALTYPDDHFDIVHAHQVLQHLTRPVDALREMRRVCRPGGIVAVRDADYSSMAWHPETDSLDRWLPIYLAVARGNDADPDAGRKIHAWAADAGFSDITKTASVWCFADEVDTAWWGGLWADRLLQSSLTQQAIDGNHATLDELTETSEAFRRWSQDPDAWFSVIHGEILCRP